MKMIRTLGLGLLLSMGALAPPFALAWGSAGHAIVGALADRLIEGSHAHAEVAALLLPGETLELAANWLDCAKGTFCGPATPEMIAYTLANPKHGQYHYTDIPFQRARYRDGMVGAGEDDIVHTLKQAIKVLQNLAQDREADAALNPHHFTPRQALMLVAHLVGDIHQPLHVGAAYVDRHGQFVLPAVRSDVDGVTVFDTRGGNNFLLDQILLTSASARLMPSVQGGAAVPAGAVALLGPAKRNFHAYWDINVVDHAMRLSHAATPAQFADGAIASLPALPEGYPGHRGAVGSDPANWPAQWGDDGLRVAKLAYAGVRPGRHGAQLGRNGHLIDVWMLTLPPDYPLTSAALARQQLARAGYRLAALLQAIWP